MSTSPEFEEIEVLVYRVLTAGTLGHRENLVLSKSNSQGWTMRRFYFLPVDNNNATTRVQVRETLLEELAGIIDLMQDRDQEDDVRGVRPEVVRLDDDQIRWFSCASA